MKLIFIISAFISFVISILFLISLIALIGGGGNVLLPGLGLIVAMWFIVIVLFIMAIISISITILLYKIAFKKAIGI
jgi:hypothetical protein